MVSTQSRFALVPRIPAPTRQHIALYQGSCLSPASVSFFRVLLEIAFM